jgi:hypothetical protein
MACEVDKTFSGDDGSKVGSSRIFARAILEAA